MEVIEYLFKFPIIRWPLLSFVKCDAFYNFKTNNIITLDDIKKNKYKGCIYQNKILTGLQELNHKATSIKEIEDHYDKTISDVIHSDILDTIVVGRNIILPMSYGVYKYTSSLALCICQNYEI